MLTLSHFFVCYSRSAEVTTGTGYHSLFRDFLTALFADIVHGIFDPVQGFPRS